MPPIVPAAPAANGASTSADVVTEVTNSAMDAVFGTRSYTPGAALQKPRKVPLRVEPKTWFANERTFLSWMSMAVTMGGVSTALVGFTGEEVDPAEGPSKGAVSPRFTEIITCMLTPIAILMIAYGLFVYLQRTMQLKRKLMGFYQDTYGPATLCICVMLALTTITVIAFVDVIKYH